MHARETWSRACDRTVTGGILLLVVYTPVAFGAVHPWAFILMEALIFLLIAVWMVKVILAQSSSRPVAQSPSRFLRAPLLLFLVFVTLQITPLPPFALRALSPAAYELYTRSLPGWPEETPYEEFQEETGDWRLETGATFPQVSSLKPPVPGSPTQSSVLGPQSSISEMPDSGLRTPHSLWLPLSIAPDLSKTTLLKLLAYVGAFLLVLLYPFGFPEDRRAAEQRFFRVLLVTILCTGVAIAFQGIVQRFTWNGKLLWFFVPQDWDGPMYADAPRASGPFVNSDHFANYLAQILPLGLVGLVSRRAFARRSNRLVARLVFGSSAVVLFMGILLSLSRAGWIGAAFGAGLLYLLLPPERRQQFWGERTGAAARLLLRAAMVCALLALVFIGPAGRQQVDIRLEQTMAVDTSLQTRLEAWRDSLAMIRDFPFLGVGLGAWPELFPRYQRPPWSPNFMREAHNDYVQGLAELGVVGLGALGMFFAMAGYLLINGLRQLPTGAAPISAALLASLAVMAVHEMFDFNLQIPANALLFSLLLGLALRLTTENSTDEPASAKIAAARSSWLGAGKPTTALVTTFLLIGIVLRQEKVAYPDNLQTPNSPAEARATLLSYPALASMHQALFELTKEQWPLERRLAELEIALWLDPRDPSVRDLYAQTLLDAGRTQEGLQELTRSMMLSPRLAAHAALASDAIGGLSEPEQRAVEEGLRQAVSLQYEGAQVELAALYHAFQRYAEAGQLYAEAARREEREVLRLYALLNAGFAFAKGGEPDQAETYLRQAISLAPRDPRPYQYLALYVCAAREDRTGMKAILREGALNGADVVALLVTWADAAQKIGDRETAKAALNEALKQRGSSFEALFKLGLVYLQEKNFERAALLLRKAAKLKPDAPQALYQLAIAEEGRYQFAAAQEAYGQAVALDPRNTGLRQRYEAFQRRVAANR